MILGFYQWDGKSHKKPPLGSMISEILRRKEICLNPIKKTAKYPHTCKKYWLFLINTHFLDFLIIKLYFQKSDFQNGTIASSVSSKGRVYPKLKMNGNGHVPNGNGHLHKAQEVPMESPPRKLMAVYKKTGDILVLLGIITI